MARARLSLGQAAGFVLGAFLLAQLLGALVADVVRTLLAARGASVEQVAASPAAVIPAMFVSTAALLMVAVVAPLLCGVRLRDALGLRGAQPHVYFAAALGTVMLGPAADALMRVMETLLPDATIGVLPMLRDVVLQTPAWIVWPFFALLPGVSEELLFRGLLQRAAPPGLAAIVISGVAFALFHVDPHHVVGVLPLGLFLAWVGARAGTWVTVFAHVVNNTAAIAAVHFEAFDVGYASEEPMPISWVPLGLGLAAGCAWSIASATRAQRG